MAVYDFFRFGDDGHVKGNETREYVDDLDALDAAYDQWRDFDVEVWRGPIACRVCDARSAASALGFTVKARAPLNSPPCRPPMRAVRETRSDSRQ